MNWSVVVKDFKRNKSINIALFLFMAFSSILAVLSVLMVVNTFTSISELYEVAQPPHFLQMHKGQINQEEIDRFMSKNEKVVDSQTTTMINIYGENLRIIGRDKSFNLSDVRLDIGLVKQNKDMDLLLNSKHEKVNLNEGEIGIPVLLREMHSMEIGDTVVLTNNGVTKEFVIKEFILDAMMNSPMVSSTRILLNDSDFNELLNKVGENEYLINAYFEDTSDAAEFLTTYQNAGLPQNGQAVTYSMIFLLSALTDIITVFVLLLASLLLIIVSFICVRFTIIAALQDEVGEIGTMKAIGLTFSDIRGYYLSKYQALAFAAVVVGLIIAFFLRGIFTSHISNTFGKLDISPLEIALSILVSILVFLLIVFYCRKILKKIKSLTVVDALVSGIGFDNHKGSIKDGLHKSKKLSVNVLIGLREVIYSFKNWSIVFVVVLIDVMLIMVPVNLLNTFEAPEFITYMGSSLEDILIEVETGESLEDNYQKVKKLLENDNAIENYYEYRTVRGKTSSIDNLQMNLDIDSGDNAGNYLKYLSGRAPEAKNEIAVSYLNANEMGKETGDNVDIIVGNKKQNFVISGIYQDVTSGGLTAKSKYDFPELTSVKYSFSVNLNDGIEIERIADEWDKTLGTGINVDPMDEFINQTLGGVAKQLRNMVFAIIVIGIFIVLLITVLFLKLRLAKDLAGIAVLKAIGFSEKDISVQYLVKMGLVSTLGILLGIILTNLLGEKIVNLALSLSGLGIKQINLINNSLMEYFIVPLLFISLILSATWIVMRTIKKYNIISIIKE